ncbi:MAG: glycosyltransferase family 2 protein [Chloroflexota bacterium]|nr:glycosyltransferase family 2 protein [Chloroflexota bacterium]
MPVEPTPIHVSLVVPAYNEMARIEASLAAILDFFAHQPYTTEVILADDGSTDGTAETARAMLAGHPTARVLTIPHGGKARAVRQGMTEARGELIAFSDIDLATPLHYLDDLRASVLGGCHIAIASREGIGARRLDEPGYRHVMGRVFNLLVRIVVLPGIDDTQCGFKMFERQTARAILAASRLYASADERVVGPRVTAFDVELLFVAKHLGYRVCPIPVIWTAGEKSKVNPVSDTVNNIKDVLRIRLNAWRGLYR